ncbi:aldo/keto reductase (plasmid) [Deinococcus metallilatus]|uniref:Aldo/keto reductase n=1 Tax=Deinococcus metallilatus TaxID=1211322 RepID=A0AAJ5F6B0_9DEIO|nr:aldo/keto reductase [Deinococcus metallilatus]MBB5293510.1 D-threo-aldose 1-dehydrogenase [Deinococcus metallilatus]QBY06588.1 aldo/keto reductase [Deinococcus metallilatus]RXJ17931.1 aldo/keto reductase [Deinococcus metallilatus]TLK32202.1 aldo/keto reductase [Deinococcus metallilatus]GMA15270.1 oxidoreductase [Deinococcus metallilatus]
MANPPLSSHASARGKAPVATRALLNGRGHVCALGLGTANLGGLYEPCEPDTALDLVDEALALGVTHLDTAPWYGFGQSETYLRSALAPHARETYTLSTKVGRLLRADAPVHPSQIGEDGQKVFCTSSPLNVVYDYSYDGVQRSVEESLARLGLDRLDIAFIHDPDVTGVRTRDLLGGAARALEDLRDQGVIRAYGAGMNQAAQLTEIVRESGCDVILLAGRYTLLEQGALDDLLPACLERRVSVVVGGVYNSGLLADPEHGHYDYAAVPEALRDRARRMQAVCARHGVSLKAAALQFPAAHPAVVSTLVGVGTTAHLRENVALWQQPVPQDCWAELREAGLLRPDAPVPDAPPEREMP